MSIIITLIIIHVVNFKYYGFIFPSYLIIIFKIISGINLIFGPHFQCY